MNTDTPVESISQLVDHLRGGEKPVDRFRIGTEHEKIGLRREDLGSVPYEGERGIGALLENIAREDDWKPIFEAGKVIALEKDGASITLEPGGQLELSGAPLRTIFETCARVQSPPGPDPPGLRAGGPDLAEPRMQSPPRGGGDPPHAEGALPRS